MADSDGGGKENKIRGHKPIYSCVEKEQRMWLKTGIGFGK